MRILYISNFLNYHQTTLWDNFVTNSDVDFVFLSTEDSDMKIKPREERSYNLYSRDFNDDEILSFLNTFEVIIIGACCDSRLIKFLPEKCVIFHNSEHFWKKFWTPITFAKRIMRMIELHHRYKKHSQLYLLANSSYLKKEFDTFRIHYKKCFKFGYYPPVNTIEEKIYCRRKKTIVYIGRMINWKRPYISYDAYKYLKKYNSDWNLTFYGEGKLRKKIEKYASKDGNIKVYGFVKHDEVLEKFLDADIFIFSSNRQEGWGAVLNEALSCGCIVFASIKAGATRFLIKDGFNGFTFKNRKELFEKIDIFENMGSFAIKQMRKNAFNTIYKLWNAKNASDRLHEIILKISNKENLNSYSEGPISLQ